MAELIRKDDTLKIIADTIFLYGTNSRVEKEIIRIVSQIPTVDVLQLFNSMITVGKWIPVEVSSGRDSWRCSVCGRHARGKTKNLPYCHCGAKMEVEEK